jgi:hypothetical protein
MSKTNLVTPRVEFSPGLRECLQLYCRYRNWSTVAPGTAEKLRELINRAGSTEECAEGLRWFFESRWVDDWVENERPDLGLDFLEQNWERFEIFKAEQPKRNYFSFDKQDYAIMRAS